MSRIFHSNKKESGSSFFFRFFMNLAPVYRGTGSKITFISSDWREVHLRLSLSWKTRNYVGTIFGGSIYAAADPILMLQIMKILGKDYVVWDKSAAVRFKKPAKTAIFMQFLVEEEIIDQIKENISAHREFEFQKTFNWIDKAGKIYASVDKTIYIADKEYYKSKIQKRKDASR